MPVLALRHSWQHNTLNVLQSEKQPSRHQSCCHSSSHDSSACAAALRAEAAPRSRRGSSSAPVTQQTEFSRGGLASRTQQIGDSMWRAWRTGSRPAAVSTARRLQHARLSREDFDNSPVQIKLTRQARVWCASCGTASSPSGRADLGARDSCPLRPQCPRRQQRGSSGITVDAYLSLLCFHVRSRCLWADQCQWTIRLCVLILRWFSRGYLCSHLVRLPGLLPDAGLRGVPQNVPEGPARLL